jgi:hypothetical protein
LRSGNLFPWLDLDLGEEVAEEVDRDRERPLRSALLDMCFPFFVRDRELDESESESESDEELVSDDDEALEQIRQ